MAESIIKFLENLIGNSPNLITFIVASLPISELRGAIPLAILEYGFSPGKAYFIAVLGNFLPILPLLLFLNYLTDKLAARSGLFRKFFNWWFERTRKRSSLIEKYEAIGLTLFVAIPLPVTGAWTGCVAAYLFKIRSRFAIPCIMCGVLIAGVVVTLTTLGIKGLF